jgi:hypothetical protein
VERPCATTACRLPQRLGGTQHDASQQRLRPTRPLPHSEGQERLRRRQQHLKNTLIPPQFRRIAGHFASSSGSLSYESPEQVNIFKRWDYNRYLGHSQYFIMKPVDRNLKHMCGRICGLLVRVPGYRSRGLGFDFRDRLCGLVVRLPGYRSRAPGFDSRHYQIF